jgi:transposase
MTDRTTLLFALPGFTVLDVTLEPGGGRVVLVENEAAEGGCPACGVVSTRVKDRPLSRVKDLPHGPTELQLVVRKRRFYCAESDCPRKSFTEVSGELPPRARLTGRLRSKVAAAVTRTNRAMSDVAAEHHLSWWTVHRILVAAAAAALPPPAPTAVLGVDETRTRRVRWLFADGAWARSDPWMTSIVDLDPTHRSAIIGLTPGRTGACVEAWIKLTGSTSRDAVRIVTIDPSAPYASGIGRALPNARIAVDHFHLVMLGNQMVTDVRQRAQRERSGRRGTTANPAWAHRQLLLRAGDRLSQKGLTRLMDVLERDDPTDQIGAAWGVKELLRQLLMGNGPTRYSRHLTAHRLTRFLTACADAQMPETTRLAATVERWWPEIEAFLELGITNAGTEGHNRVIKQIKRVGCGFRNQDNYQRRIMLHNAARNAA